MASLSKIPIFFCQCSLLELEYFLLMICSKTWRRFGRVENLRIESGPQTFGLCTVVLLVFYNDKICKFGASKQRLEGWPTG